MLRHGVGEHGELRAAPSEQSTTIQRHRGEKSVLETAGSFLQALKLILPFRTPQVGRVALIRRNVRAAPTLQAS